VSDSVVILINNSDFPREIIEIISQHHGTTLLKYFYNKDKDKESDYKYKTTKPNSIESMVLMVCDSVEATSRALVQAGKFDPDTVINDTLQRAIDSGQLDNVTIKLGDLKKIKSALAKELEGMYQKRIEYPPEEVEDTND
jgi:hypothetical protein